MNIYIHKSHDNVTVLLYHIAFLAKYRKAVCDREVNEVLKTVYLEMEKRYAVEFPEIGSNQRYFHVVMRSIPMHVVKKLVQTIQSIPARQVFNRCLKIKQKL